MEQIKIIDSDSSKNFEEEINELLKEGWTISSTSCGFINSEEYSFKDLYQAILIHKPKPNVYHKVIKYFINLALNGQSEDEKEFWEAFKNQEPYSGHLNK